MMLPPDVLRYIPIIGGMSVREIANYCLMHRDLQIAVWNNHTFWIEQGLKWLSDNREKLARVPLERLREDIYNVQVNRLNGYVSFKDKDIPEAYLHGYLGYTRVASRHGIGLRPNYYIYGAITGNHPEIYEECVRENIDTFAEYILCRTAIIGGNLQLLKTAIAERKRRRTSFFHEKREFALVLHRSNVEIFNYFMENVEGINLEDGFVHIFMDNRADTYDIGGYSIPLSMHDFPPVTDIHIVNTLLPLVNDVTPTLIKLINSEYSSEKEQLLQHILKARPEVDRKDLFLEVVGVGKAPYVALLLPGMMPATIKKAVPVIMERDVFDVLLPHLSEEDLHQIFWENADSEPAIVSYFASRYSKAYPDEFSDAFIKVVISGSDVSPAHQLNIVKEYIPYLTDQQRAYGRRIAKKENRPMLHDLFS